MNIVQKFQQQISHQNEKSVDQKNSQMTPHAQYLEDKKSFRPEMLQDINNFKKEFPQLKDHVIYKIMKKHDFKKTVVETELKYTASLQTQVSDDFPSSKQTAQPKKKKLQNVPKPKNINPNIIPEIMPNHKNENNQKTTAPLKEFVKPKPHWSNREEYYDNAVDNQKFYGNEQNNNKKYYKEKPVYIPYKNESVPYKKYKNTRNNYTDSVEYIQKPVSEEPVKQQTKPVEQELPCEKALSNINEESEDFSHHKFQPDQNAFSGRDGNFLQIQPTRISEKEKKISTKFESIDINVKPEHFKQHSNTKSELLEFGLVANGLNLLVRSFLKRNHNYFRTFFQNVYFLDSKQPKLDQKQALDKKNGFFEAKKKKPAIKNLFETEENDESNHERAKKMNYFVGQKKFESEEERLKGDRERVMESKLNDHLSQFNFLNHKIMVLENEMNALKLANMQLLELNKNNVSKSSENVYCLVPYSFVKDTYPFSNILHNDLKSGNVYMIKKDD